MSLSECRTKLQGSIIGREPEAIARTLAMMAYHPAIGRALEKGGVGRFQDLIWESIRRLYEVQNSREDFDHLHDQICGRIVSEFKTNRKETLSYGQAQKPLNVFLKVYVDWARQPTRDLAEKLTPFLHVPLDSLLMKFFKRECLEDYETHITKIQRQHIERTAERLTRITGRKYTTGITRSVIGGEFSLSGMNKEIYLAWQQFLRSLHPTKPVAIDIIWALERQGLKEEPAGS